MRPKKKADTTKVTRVAQPTSGSLMRSRYLRAMAAMYPARISVHRMIEPSSADHMAVKVYSSGVDLLEFSATNLSEKSWVNSACSMAAAASSAPTRISQV